jgi:hypothetical protein
MPTQTRNGNLVKIKFVAFLPHHHIVKVIHDNSKKIGKCR